MSSTYLLDTNVFLFDPLALNNFSDCDVVLPLEVIEEIDRFKREPSETGRNARATAQTFDELRQRGSLRTGINLDNNCRLRIAAEHYDFHTSQHHNAAEALLQLALQIQAECPAQAPVIISKNVNLRVKADALGLAAQDYKPLDTVDAADITGWHRRELSLPEITRLQEGGGLDFRQEHLHPNEFVFAQEIGQPKNAVCARMDWAGEELLPILDTTRVICGIRSLNVEQTFTINALLDPQISLVTLSGKAGTGKTLLAIAAGLQQIFADGRYQRLLVFRPTLPVSRDLGYLPGELSDKMRPWMQPVFDALEFIRCQDRKSPARVLPHDVLGCPEISVEPLTYIRGRSIPNQFIIIDEAQNLTPLEVKTVITRVGAGSKIVLTGDPEQIDNPYLDVRSNGLTCLVKRFLPSPLSAHVTLIKGERSELAETAATLL
ncbi:MAG: PhoH family protein [Lentisphaerae bacterium]|nr:PhoH family protein [Lentisphaerota bacterium]